jgi:DNA helicase-2/ATP-dependent DNA helicase PcrA
VTVATIHSAKGLEYKCVFVAGLDEKVLPIARSMGDDDELEEERRLMYVAVTRARERLHLTRASSRYMYGRREFMTQSRFLKEAKEVLYPERVEETPKYSQTPNYYKADYSKDEDTYTSRTGYSSNYAKTFLSQTKPKTNASNNTKGYKSGVKVKHAKFGEGTVIMVKGEGNNLIVDVAFKGVGIKSLSVAYAPMEIL